MQQIALQAAAGVPASGLQSAPSAGVQHYRSEPLPMADETQAFLESLARARTQGPAQEGPASPTGVGDTLALGQMGDFMSRLSDSQAKNFKALESLSNLDPLSPDGPAQTLGVMVSMAKSSMQTEFTGKFASKISESFNRLLNT